MVDEKTLTDFTPRKTPFLIGHTAEAGVFLNAFNSGRLHHAWLISGPRGVGKATLAYHLGRFLLDQGGHQEGEGLFGEEAAPNAAAGIDALYTAEDDPLFIRVATGAEGNLKVIERGINEKTGKKRTEIIVDDVRALHDFFEKTASREGWRVAIVDSADAMNRSAANALLKMLEEPPRKSVLLLVSHARGRLVPTIKSRCQQVMLQPLKEGEVSEVVSRLRPEMAPDEIKALAKLSGGSPGFALRLALYQGEKLFDLASALIEGAAMKTAERHRFAAELAVPANEAKYYLFLDIAADVIARKMREAAAGGAAKSRLDRLLELWEKVNRILGEGEGLNLGRKQMILLLLEDLASAGTGGAKAA